MTGSGSVPPADGLVVVNETSDCIGLLPCRAGILPGWSMYENAVFRPYCWLYAYDEVVPVILVHNRRPGS